MDKEQRKVMETFGVPWQELKDGDVTTKGHRISLQTQAKATYYKSTGEPLPNLPADPVSMRKYLSKGFTLTPPCEWPSKKVIDLEAIAPKVADSPVTTKVHKAAKPTGKKRGRPPKNGRK